LLVISYNPGYQSILKDLKHSTRQRFVTIEFTYPPRDKEAQVIAHESGLDLDIALDLARLGEKVRYLKGQRLRRRRQYPLADLCRPADHRGVPARRACAWRFLAH
jgi:nitric oxide reductase NorQ protein